VEHEVLLDVAYAALDGDVVVGDDLRALWEEHTEREIASLQPLGNLLGLGDVVAAHANDLAHTSAILTVPTPDPRRIRGAIGDHVDAWEFEVFPHLMMAAEDDELRDAADRMTAVTTAGR
jgi:hypothetical protein